MIYTINDSSNEIIFLNRRIAFIINPAAKSGRARKIWNHKCVPIVNELFPDTNTWKSFFTLQKGHARELTIQAISEGYNVICSVGGDGTHNEVVNGIMESVYNNNHNIEFAVVSLGTGGDLIRTIFSGLERSLYDSLKLLKYNDSIPIDIGLVQSTHINQSSKNFTYLSPRYFINIASVGIGGKVCRRVEKSSKSLGKSKIFLFHTIIQSLKWNSPRISYSINQNIWNTMNLYQLTIANARYHGGGMFVAPNAKMSDGKFDVLAMRDMKLYDINLLRKTYSGRHLSSNKITYCLSDMIDVVASDNGSPIYIEIDGEEGGMLPARFSLIPNAIRLIVPTERENEYLLAT